MSTLLTIAFLLCLYVLWVMHTMGPWTPTELLKECIRRVIILPCILGLASGEIEAEAGTLKCRFLLWLYGDDPEIVTYVEGGTVPQMFVYSCAGCGVELRSDTRVLPDETILCTTCATKRGCRL